MISDKVQKYSIEMKKDERYTLRDKRSEAHSVLYIKALDDIILIEVDHALVPDQKQQQKKSDFLVWTLKSGKTHIIELKGKNIEAAFEQIIQTINVLGEDDDTKELVTGRNVLDAYISSPNQQKVPAIYSRTEKDLARMLAAKCKIKPQDIFQLIHFVKVVQKQKKLVVSGRKILTSNDAPLEFG